MSTTSSFLIRSAGVLVLTLVSAACGSSSSSLTAPSSPLAATATIQGLVNGGGATTASAHTAALSGAGLRVSVVGQPLSAMTDGQGRFTLGGVPAGSVTLRIEGPGIDAQLRLGGLVEGQVLSIEIEVQGSQAKLVTGSSGPGPGPSPSPTPTPSPSPRPGEDDVEFRGSIESITPPSLHVAGRLVDTNASTRILRGDTAIALSDLRVGELVEVEGSSANGAVLASKIKVEDESGDDDGSADDSGNHGGGSGDDGGGDDGGGSGGGSDDGGSHGGGSGSGSSH